MTDSLIGFGIIDQTVRKISTPPYECKCLWTSQVHKEWPLLTLANGEFEVKKNSACKKIVLYQTQLLKHLSKPDWNSYQGKDPWEVSQSIWEVKGIRKADKGRLIRGSFAYLISENCLKTEFAQEPGTSTCSTYTDSFSHHVYLLTGKVRKKILNLKLKHWLNTSRCLFYHYFYSKTASQGCIIFEPIFSP